MVYIAKSKFRDLRWRTCSKKEYLWKTKFTFMCCWTSSVSLFITMSHYSLKEASMSFQLHWLNTDDRLIAMATQLQHLSCPFVSGKSSGFGKWKCNTWVLCSVHSTPLDSSPQSNLIVTGIKRLGQLRVDVCAVRTVAHGLTLTDTHGDWMDSPFCRGGWGAGVPADSQDHQLMQDVWRTWHRALQHHTRYRSVKTTKNSKTGYFRADVCSLFTSWRGIHKEL